MVLLDKLALLRGFLQLKGSKVTLALFVIPSLNFFDILIIFKRTLDDRCMLETPGVMLRSQCNLSDLYNSFSQLGNSCESCKERATCNRRVDDVCPSKRCKCKEGYLDDGTGTCPLLSKFNLDLCHSPITTPLKYCPATVEGCPVMKICFPAEYQLKQFPCQIVVSPSKFMQI